MAEPRIRRRKRADLGGIGSDTARGSSPPLPAHALRRGAARRCLVLDAQAEKVDRADGGPDEAAADPLGDEEREDRVTGRQNQGLLVDQQAGKGDCPGDSRLPAEALEAFELSRLASPIH